MAISMIQFGEWMPDQAGITEALQEAVNVIPQAIGYAPFPNSVNLSTDASESLKSMFVAKYAGETSLFAAGATKIYKYSSDDFGLDDVSKTVRVISNVARTSNVTTITTSAAHGYTTGDVVTVAATTNTSVNGSFTITGTPTTTTFTYANTGTDITSVSATGTTSIQAYTTADRFYFTQFGKKVICSNGNSRLQAWELGVSSTFQDLDASAPNAKFVAVVRDFVVAANIAGDENKVIWSDINDETDWTPSDTSQSDYQLLPDGGDIIGLTGGEFGLIFLERAIVRMSYIGSPLFFQFDTIAKNIGCYSSGSIAQFGNLSFFLSDNGFYMCDGQTVTPIGAEKVDKYFFQILDPNQIDSMSAAIDYANKLVVWQFIDIFAKDKLFVYNWQSRKWTICETDSTFVATAATTGVTLEGLDAYGTVDSIGTTWDSRLWAGGKFVFAGIQGSKLITFTGAPKEGYVTTGDLGNGNQSIVMLAKPKIDNGAGSVSVASRQLLNEVPVFSTAVASDAEGRVSLRSSGKYHRVRVYPTGSNWDIAVGTEVDIVSQGGR